MIKPPIIRGMTFKYVAVLCVLGGLLITDYIIFHTFIDNQATSAAIVNISGRQRMLSQRMTMYAHRLTISDTAAERKRIGGMLLATASLMERSHQGLINGDKEMNLPGSPSPELRAIYFNPPHELDKKVRAFLADARSLVEATERGIDPKESHANLISEAISDSLLKSFSAVVNQYQLESESQISQLDMMAEIGLFLSLFVLALSGFGVFRPLARRVVNEMEKLANAEKRLRVIFNSVADGIITVDEFGVVRSFNRAAMKIFGYSREEVVGRNVSMLMPEPHRGRHDGYISNYINTGEANILGVNREVVGQRKDGAIFPLGIALAETFIDDRLTFIAVVRDITQRKSEEEQLKIYQRELERRVEERTSKLRQEVSDRRQAEEALGEQTRLVKFLHQLAVAANEAKSPKEAYQSSIDNVCAYTGWPVGHVYIRDDKAPNTLISSGIWHFDQPKKFEKFRDRTEKTFFKSGNGLPGRVLSTRKPIWITDITVDSNFPRAKQVKDIGVKAAFALPVLVGMEVVAVLEFYSEQAMDTDETLLKVLTQIGTQIGRVVERQRMEAAYREGQQRLQAITGSLFEGVLVVDVNGHIVFANRSAEKLLVGHDGGRLAGCDVDGVFQIRKGGDIISFANGPFIKVAESGQTFRNDDAVFVASNGDVLHVAFACSPLLEKGVSRGAIISFRDIHELKEAQSEAFQSSKLASVGQLAAGIAHEINTPTQYIGDNLRFLDEAHGDIAKVLESYRKLVAAARKADVLLDRVAEAEAAAEEADLEYLLEEIPSATEQSLGGVEQVARIVLAMKEFSHPGSKEKTAIDLNRAIENTLMVCRNEWKYAAEIDTDLDPSLPPVSCLPDELNQVFLNLIVNAAHAIEETGKDEKGRITITTRQDGDWAEIRVADTGGGIPDKISGSIFDPFFTTKDVGKGTGQGLSICRDVVVKKHGGRIFFETEPGEGTTFVVRVPINGQAASSKAV